MNVRVLLAGLLLCVQAAASTPADYASQWPVATDREGAWSIPLDEGIYRQVTRPDLADLAAFNADGQELVFGPLPPAYDAPARTWIDSAWFALHAPAQDAAGTGDLQLHVSRAADGSLSLDSTLSGKGTDAHESGTTDILIDARARDRLLEAVSFDFTDAAPDFSATVDVEASDDLQHWRTLATGAPLASFRQHGQNLLRRTVEFPAQQATYLRVHASTPLPVTAVHQLQREPGIEPARASLDAPFVRRDGNAFEYRLPARVPAERLIIALADDNAVARFAVSAREEGETDWRRIGDYTAFRLRGAGIALDAEPMDIGAVRLREWRIEPESALATTPVLRFDYRPENWFLLTHGRPPFAIVAGSRRAERAQFPIDAVIDPLRVRYGAQWRPSATSHGAMRTSAGAAALHGWDAREQRTWWLWGVLVLGAAAVAWMVVGLLRAPPKT